MLLTGPHATPWGWTLTPVGAVTKPEAPTLTPWGAILTPVGATTIKLGPMLTPWGWTLTPSVEVQHTVSIAVATYILLVQMDLS
jgi:hypothetical protein